LAEREGLPRQRQKLNKIRHFLQARWRVCTSPVSRSRRGLLDPPFHEHVDLGAPMDAAISKNPYQPTNQPSASQPAHHFPAFQDFPSALCAELDLIAAHGSAQMRAVADRGIRRPIAFIGSGFQRPVRNERLIDPYAVDPVGKSLTHLIQTSNEPSHSSKLMHGAGGGPSLVPLN
jgi:hypothetical protein